MATQVSVKDIHTCTCRPIVGLYGWRRSIYPGAWGYLLQRRGDLNVWVRGLGDDVRRACMFLAWRATMPHTHTSTRYLQDPVSTTQHSLCHGLPVVFLL